MRPALAISWPVRSPSTPTSTSCTRRSRHGLWRPSMLGRRHLSGIESWMAVSAAIALGVLLAASTVAAHPLGNFSINRYAGIRLEPAAVEIRYLVDMAEIPAFQEMQEWGMNGQADQPEAT